MQRMDKQRHCQAVRISQEYAGERSSLEEYEWSRLVTPLGIETEVPVVRTALQLWLGLPDASALEVLDLAMRAHSGEDFDFQFECELHPPHPFAELLRQAFAPNLDAAAILRESEFEESDPKMGSGSNATTLAWDCVILLFAQRYGIWGPRLT